MAVTWKQIPTEDDLDNYIPHSLADAENDFLVASGADTFVKKTLAETGAILETDINHDNLVGFVAAEHYDWTNETHDLLTTGSLASGALTVTGNLSASYIAQSKKDSLKNTGFYSTIDFNTQVAGDFGLAKTDSTNGPGASFYAVRTEAIYSSTDLFQVTHPFRGGQYWFRNYYGASWGAWRQLFDSANHILFNAASTYNVGSTTAEVANVYIGTGRAWFGAGQNGYIYDDGTYLRMGRT